MSPPRCRQIVLATLSLLAFALPAAAQPDRTEERAPAIIPREHAEQTYLFRSLLKYVGLEPIKDWPGQADRKDVVLILFGNQGVNFGHTAAYKSRLILQAGGAVLIATDKPTLLDNSFPDLSSLMITGEQIASIKPDTKTCYGRIPSADMPFLVPPPTPPKNLHLGLMSQFRNVATNSPSAFSLRPRGYVNTELARFPINCFTEDRAINYSARPIALVSDPTDESRYGPAVVFADAGIFANQMLTANDTDNFVYSYYLARYLATGPTGTKKRTKCLFIEDENIRTDFDRVQLGSAELPPLPQPPMPSLEQIQEVITDAGNRALDDVQTQDVLGQAVERHFNRLARWLAILAAAGMLAYLLVRVWAARHAANLVVPRSETANPAATGLDHRRKEILRSNDLYEPLREHLRGLFAGWGCSEGGPDLPPIEASGAKVDRRMIETRLNKLWAIAFGDVPAAIPFVRWKEIETMIEFVSRAADAGRWRFARVEGLS